MLETYRAIHPHVLELHIRWAQFRLLFTVSDRRMTVLSNIAPGFFAVIRDVLRDAAFISIRRLTDPPNTGRKHNLSLVTLAQLAGVSGDPTLSTRANSLLSDLLKRAKTIRDIGDQWIAHTDLAQGLSQTPLANMRVQRGEVDEALRLVRELMWIFADYLAEPRANYDEPIIPGDADVLARLLEGPTMTPG